MACHLAEFSHGLGRDLFSKVETAKFGDFEIKSAVLNPVGWIEGHPLAVKFFKETFPSILCLA
jgi:hypothetical protein